MRIRVGLLVVALLADTWLLAFGMDYWLCPVHFSRLPFPLSHPPFLLFFLNSIVLVLLIAALIFAGVLTRSPRSMAPAGAALQESQARYQKMTANIPGVVCQFAIRPDRTWEVCFVSDKCRDLLGVEAAAVQRDASLMFGFVHPDDLAILMAGIEEAARLMKPWSWDGRFLVCGRCKFLRGLAQPERRPDGSVLFSGLFIDVTELKRAEQALHKSNQMLQLVLDTIPSAVFWKDRDSVYQGCNRVFAKDAGLADTTAIVHKTDFDLVWREQAPKFRADDSRVMDNNAPILAYDEPLIKADRSRYWLRTSKAPMRDPEGKAIGILGTYEDVTERKQAEDLLRASLREKEVLLREIHHRVKNNLQVVSSLLSLQSLQVADPRDLKLFQESQSRVRTMSMVHESLYESHDLARSNFADYLRVLAGNLQRVYPAPDIRIQVAVADHIRLGIDVAIPCALMIHELVTNALKYAFVDPGKNGNTRRTGPDEIRIALSDEPGGGFLLAVSDNGVGLPEHVGPGQARSLGWHLIEALAKQLHGRLDIVRQNGTTVRLAFPYPAAREQRPVS